MPSLAVSAALRRWAGRAPGLWTPAGALLAAAVMVACEALSIRIRSPVGFTMLHTTTGLAGATAALLLAGQPQATRQRRHLLIALALTLLSVTDLAVAATQTPLSSSPSSIWLTAILAIQLAGAAILLLAAFSPRRASEAAPELSGALRAGMLVLAVAILNHLLVTSPQSTRVDASEILELCGYALVFWGCLVAYRLGQLRTAERVAVAERRRMAREMHDGLAQELAFIATNAQRLERGGEDVVVSQQLVAAAERALHDSRTAIAILSSPDGLPLDRLIENTARTFEGRFDLTVELEVAHKLLVDAERRNALLRILHEALTNAVRHGGARRVHVRVSGSRGGLRMRIADDGTGFDVPEALGRSTGFGLTSMSERSQLLGGTLQITSSASSGTVVEVALP